jgi:hypothetical protein
MKTNEMMMKYHELVIDSHFVIILICKLHRQTDAVIIVEINAVIRVSSASISVRGVLNREKRSWCANIELGGSKGPRSSLPLEWGAFFPLTSEYSFRIGAKIAVVVVSIHINSCNYGSLVAQNFARCFQTQARERQLFRTSPSGV